MGLFDKFKNLVTEDDDYYDDESEEKNNAEVIIAKNRHGATGSVFLQWIGQYTTFYNQDRRHE